MEPITLITGALALLKPYLIKSGEKFAETVGEDIWEWIKKSFISEDEKTLISDFQPERDMENLKMVLLKKVHENSQFKEELESAINNAQNALNTYLQQNIHNNGNIDKQINIQENSGNIQM